MLYLETEYGFVPWLGQRIRGVRHPRKIEFHWDEDHLAGWNLYKPKWVPVEPPEGYRYFETSVNRVDGVVQQVHRYEPLPNPGPTRTTAPALDGVPRAC